MRDKALRKLQRQLRRTEGLLTKVYERYTNVETTLVSGKAKWLVENFYLIEAAIKQLHKDLSPTLFKKIATLKEGRRKGYPRIYRLAERYLILSHGKFDRETFIDFVEEYQQLRELTSVEIWTIPVVLRLILLNELVFFLRSRSNLEAVKNRINSLRVLSLLHWESLFEAISPVEKILAQDPAGVYPRMEEKSKDFYRHTIEQLSQGSHLSEVKIAKLLLEKAQNTNRPKSHIGEFLRDGDLKKLKQDIGYRPNALNRWVDAIRDHPYLTYFGLVLGIMELVGIDLYASSGVWAILLVILLSDGIIALVNFFISSLVPPTPPLQIDLSDGIGDKNTTMIVVSCLLEDQKTTNEIVVNLEKRFLANKDKDVYFALLADFRDAPKEVMHQDKKLLVNAIQSIQDLNKKYASFGQHFYFLARKRIYSTSEKTWMGWERKRGKLIEFVNLLKNQESTYTHIEGNKKIFSKIKYIISLDADTTLPIGSAAKLVGAMEHPLNKPIINSHKNVVTEGYGLIQPRVDTSIKSIAKSRFSKFFSQGSGLDPYSSAISNIYQDLFGSGIYLGKAIFNVDVFYQTICGKFPVNSLLSHDLLEGNFLRTGFASNIQLLEDFPGGYDSYQKRQNRWVRGDWQFTPWLFETNLTFIGKWQIFDNLRRSLVPPVTFILFISVFLIPQMTHIWKDLLAFYFLPYLVEIMSIFTQSQIADSGKGFWFSLRTQLAHILIRLIFNFIFLANNSMNILNAVLITVLRKLFLHTNLLQWETAAKVEKTQANKLTKFVTEMRGGLIITVVSVLLIYMIHPNLLINFLPIAGLWLISPILAMWISKRYAYQPPKLTQNEEEELLQTAKHIWNFFDHTTNTSNNFIPPDSYQIAPGPKLINKTSPTNIGLYLMVLITGVDLGFIDENNFLIKVTQTIRTITKLKTYRGHLYNWYDLNTLKPLDPMVISSVDSGNLVASLMVLKQALIERPKTQKLISQIDQLVSKTNFAFLYSHEQQLFSVGFDPQTKILEDSFYDLFGSESRLTSFVAIALGQIPGKHWFTLNRPLALVNNHVTIKSWGGSIFEHFFPLLFMDIIPESLVSSTNIGLVKQQMNVAKTENRPWGMSESAYFDLGSDKTYKYRIFGNWALGIKPDLYLYRIVSPYSSFLVLPFFPNEAWQNLVKLTSLGAAAEYGFFESVDFTSSHLSDEQDYGLVTEYMAHHQAMSLIAIDNYLCQNIMVNRFHKNKEIEAIESLLEERPPTFPVIIS